MATYFKPEYEEYINALGSSKIATSSANELKTSVDALGNEMTGIITYIQEFSGEFSEEAQTIVLDMIAEADALKTTIDESLPDVMEAMTELGPDLNDIKDGDSDLEKAEKKLKEEKNKTYTSDIAAAQFDNYSDPEAEWKKYHNEQVQILGDKVDDINTKLEELVIKCDENIQKIKDFNDNLIDIQTRLATMIFVKDDIEVNYDIISNMTLEERDAYFKELIDKMTERYNEYKEAYEEYTRFQERLTDEERVVFNAVIDILGFNEYSGLLPTVTNPIQYGMAMVALSELLNKPGKFGNQDKTVLENVMDYIMNGGNDIDDVELWKSSGLMAYYINKNPDANFRPFLSGDWTDEELQQMAEDSQREFWSKLSNALGYDNVDARKHREDVVKNLRNAIDELDKSAAGFDENYQKAVQAGVAIKGLESIRVRTKYGMISESDGFKGFDPTEDDEDINDLIRSIINTGKLTDQQGIEEYLTGDEKKMFDYIYQTYGEDKAQEYLIEITEPVNKRQGMIEAQKFIDSVHSGSNENLDAIIDCIRTGGKGWVNGMEYFADGLVDIVDPSTTISKNEYAQLAILDILKNDSETGGFYYDALLESYNFGYNTGKKTIPTILNLVTPYRVGDYVELASNIGNRTEETMRTKDLSQGEAFLSSMLYESTVFLTNGQKGKNLSSCEVKLLQNLVGAVTGNEQLDVVDVMYDSAVDTIGEYAGGKLQAGVGRVTKAIGIEDKVDSIIGTFAENTGGGAKAEEMIGKFVKDRTTEGVKSVVKDIESYGADSSEIQGVDEEIQDDGWVKLGTGIAREINSLTTTSAEESALVTPIPTTPPTDTSPTQDGPDISGKGKKASDSLMKYISKLGGDK